VFKDLTDIRSGCISFGRKDLFRKFPKRRGSPHTSFKGSVLIGCEESENRFKYQSAGQYKTDDTAGTLAFNIGTLGHKHLNLSTEKYNFILSFRKLRTLTF